jgi:hypothetical protein
MKIFVELSGEDVKALIKDEIDKLLCADVNIDNIDVVLMKERDSVSGEDKTSLKALYRSN